MDFASLTQAGYFILTVIAVCLVVLVRTTWRIATAMKQAETTANTLDQHLRDCKTFRREIFDRLRGIEASVNRIEGGKNGG